MTVPPVLDSAGRRRSPATMPGYHAGRPPRNKGLHYPADPPTVEEIVAVMREASDDRHGYRLRALIVVLWRGGLRIQEALALGEHDLDPRRGSVLVRNGKGGHRREIGMDAWGWEQLRPGSPLAPSSRSGRCSASSTARPAGGPGRAPTYASSSAGSPPKRASGAASRRTSCATRMPWSSLAKASRST
jgi:integrase